MPTPPLYQKPLANQLMMPNEESYVHSTHIQLVIWAPDASVVEIDEHYYIIFPVSDLIFSTINVILTYYYTQMALVLGVCIFTTLSLLHSPIHAPSGIQVQAAKDHIMHRLCSHERMNKLYGEFYGEAGLSQ